MEYYTPIVLFKTKSDFYMAVIRYYLNKHDIRVKKWFKSLNAARYYAYQDTKTVGIPLPNSRLAFLICLHEIGHIVEGEKKFGFYNEYVAEMFVITEAAKWEVDTISYERNAKQYVKKFLVNDWNRGRINIDNINFDVEMWLELDYNKMKKWPNTKLKLQPNGIITKLQINE